MNVIKNLTGTTVVLKDNLTVSYTHTHTHTHTHIYILYIYIYYIFLPHKPAVALLGNYPNS